MSDTELQDSRKLPVQIHWQLDDQELSLIAYRVYGHICRVVEGNDLACPSYQSIGDICFSADSNSYRTRRDWAMKAIKELCDRRFIGKDSRVSRDSQGTRSNSYRILGKEYWLPPCSRVVIAGNSVLGGGAS